MFEAQWPTSTDPAAMLTGLRSAGRGDNRKLRLFGVACCRAVPTVMAAPWMAGFLDVVERFADGQVSMKELSTAFYAIPRTDVIAAARNLRPASVGWTQLECARFSADPLAELAGQADLLRDLFGVRLYRQICGVHPSWRTDHAVPLAATIYADRAFDLMPVLADALEEAGCDDPHWLDHCRGPGPHARGCWVLDLLLGRSAA